jgi:hypothetical protein
MAYARRLASLVGASAASAGTAHTSLGNSLASWQVRLASGTMDGATIALMGRVGPDYAFVQIDTMDVDSSGSGIKWAAQPVAMFELRLDVVSISNAGTLANLPSIYGDIWVM